MRLDVCYKSDFMMGITICLGGDYDMFITKEPETPGIVWVKARSGVLGRNEQVPYCRDEACRFGGVD